MESETMGGEVAIVKWIGHRVWGRLFAKRGWRRCPEKEALGWELEGGWGEPLDLGGGVVIQARNGRRHALDSRVD